MTQELEPYYTDWLSRIENEGLHEKEDIARRFAEYSLALDNLVSAAAFDCCIDAETLCDIIEGLV